MLPPFSRCALILLTMHYERAPVLQEEGWVAGAACGGFAPAPPGFNALVPLPIGSFCKQMAKKGCRSIPLDRSRPQSRRSGCFPAWPYPPLSSRQILLRREKSCIFGWVLKVRHYLGGSVLAEGSRSPQGGTQHAE
jgi:hypothetical protein